MRARAAVQLLNAYSKRQTCCEQLLQRAQAAGWLGMCEMQQMDTCVAPLERPIWQMAAVQTVQQKRYSALSTAVHEIATQLQRTPDVESHSSSTLQWQSHRHYCEGLRIV